MDPRDRRALAEYRQHRLVLAPGYATPPDPRRVASVDGRRALVRDLSSDRYYLAERQPSGSVRYRPLVRTPEIHVRGRVPEDRPRQSERATQRATSGRPLVPPPATTTRPPTVTEPRASAPATRVPASNPAPATRRVPFVAPRRPSGPTVMRPIPRSPHRSSRSLPVVPNDRPTRPPPGGLEVSDYQAQLEELERQLSELRDHVQSQRATSRPESDAPRHWVTDPLDPRFVSPPPSSAELSTTQGRWSRGAQDRIRARADARGYLNQLRREWQRLAWVLNPIERPDPEATMRWLDEIVTTEHGTGPRWQMIHRADAERLRRALEFGDRLRSSPMTAAVYGTARLVGLDHDEAQAITEDPGYQLTHRLLTGLGMSSAEAADYAATVAVVVALIGLASQLRRPGRNSGRRPPAHGTRTAPATSPRRAPNRTERRAADAEARRARRRQARAEARQSAEAQRQARQSHDRDRRARQSADATRRRLRSAVRHPDARVTIPALRRSYADDWDTPEAIAEYRREHEATQGFSGVYDPVSGEIIVRPSAPNRSPGPFSAPPRGWATRGGPTGHEALAEELRGPGWNATSSPIEERVRAFTLIRDGDGFVIGWESVGVNQHLHRGPRSFSNMLPLNLRREVLNALRYHTGERIRDGG